MKRMIWVSLLVLVAIQLSAKKSYTIESPDKMIALKVDITDKVEYAISHGEDVVLEKSPVSMLLTDGTGFGVNPILRKAEINKKREHIDAPLYKKKSVADSYNGLLLRFKGDYSIEFRVYDDGVAYRFISEKGKSFCVQNEQAVFNFPKQSKAYVTYVRENGYHADNKGNKGTFEEQFFKSFVNTYSYMNLSDWKPERLAFMPLLVEIGHGKKVCLTEADLLNYPGMYLNSSNTSNTLHGVFAPCPKTVKQGGVDHMQEVIVTRENYIATCEGNTRFPWRTLVISAKDIELANSDMVYRLSTPNQIGDVSWIKPGKAVWEWWNSCNLYGVDFNTGINNETYKYYIRFAAENQLEYMVIDAGWYKGTDIMNVVDEVNLKELVAYGKERNVGIVLWTGSYPFIQDIEGVCKHYAEMGIKGFKIDFMDRDDQSMVNFHYHAAKIAAKHNLVLDFHGTYKPTGLNRTCPNVLTFEAVQGLEHMKWAAPNVDQVTYDVTMPYIRMIAGPLDYTQGAMRNASKRNYRPVHSEPMSQGTRCRQLAEYVIFESPFSMLCDSPSAYMRETECTDFIADIPVVWNQSLALSGEVAKFITLARKKENVWYVAAINNWDTRNVNLDLAFLGKGDFKAEVFRDGLNADKVAQDYKREIVNIPFDRKMSFTMAPGGGYIMKIDRFCTGEQEKLPVYLDDSMGMEHRIEDALSRMTLEEKVAMIHAQSKFSTPGCPRLGIPELWMSDGPHGIRAEISWDSWGHAGWTNDYCTAFPALTCLAATFNPALSLTYGKAIGEEARFRKKEVLLGPGVNIYRTPLNGRNFEYMGEDPYLAAQMVVPYIQGVQQNGVAACLKHFVANNQEYGRKQINVTVSERALREIYFPAFKAGVEKGKAWAVMGSYNKYKNQHCTHNEWLVNNVLKGEWRFDGAFISDWGSTRDTDEAACNGLDIEMGSRTDGLHYTEKMAYDNYFLANPYLEKLRKKELSMDDLDDKVRRVLRLSLRTNMSRERCYGSLVTPEHLSVARHIAEEGIVLLKNQANFFPIPIGQYRKIAVIGDNAVRSLTLGGGSSELKVKKEVSPLEGLQAIYGEDKIVYSSGYTSGPSKFHPYSLPVQKADSLIQAAVAVAKDADIVLFFGGLNKNQYQDCEGVDRKDFKLPYRQDELLTALLEVNKKVAVVLISGNAVAMPWLNQVPALMQSWYLGSEAGNAIANVIVGQVTPSGKLPFSIPERLADNGAHSFGHDSYPGDTLNVVYQEDILVGYRWHDTKKIPALFPFGYGLSYTTFNYGKMTADKQEYAPADTVRVRFTLTNTGGTEGAEVVQLYVGQDSPSVLRPTKELKAFDKIKLQPGESREVSLTVPVKEFAYFDENKKTWVIESDRYTLYCAASAKEIKSAVKIKVKL